ncbi:MAG: DNA replication complex GINS family protein [Candidatus Aenigmarchaeota archaeon]|nr:DNA replication complex GINS family protein [Candidatus Aenigmarchaeota archaeon]
MLTFEAIRDMERGEAEGKTLQKLPENFMEEVRQYLALKESNPEKNSADIHEIENAKRSVKSLFEKRERKLVEQALYTVKTGMPTENLTQDEERLYLYIVEEVKKHRERFFSSKTVEPAPEKMNAYRVRSTIPRFVGPDMKTYELKEFQVLQEGELPKPLNDLLLKKNLLEVI